ncbi:TolB family protein [Nocardioides ferulae]|uniref:TolB family protein n=1 Tax=Nocardioides ferulae TaxID=2340821 RepID=UPI000EB1C5D5|nr:hypothetical protein [Nocardioides ferulae]
MTDSRTDPWGDLNLHEALDRATDAIEPPGLAAAALTEAHRRRVRTRGAASALGAVAAVAALIVSLQAVSGDPRTQERPAEPASSGAADAVQAQVAPAIPRDRVQPIWDPRGAEGLPVVELGVPRVLPVTAAGPVTRAVALLDGEEGTLLVGTDGLQTSLDLPDGLGEQRTVVLSPDGQRVAAVGASGLFWRAVDGGSWQRIEVPGVSLEASLSWAPDSESLVLVDHRTGVRVGLGTGEQEPLPFLRGHAAYALAPDGAVVHGTDTREIVERRDGEVVRRTASGPLEGLVRPAVGGSAIAFARANLVVEESTRASDRDGLVVVDRDDFDTRAYLPVPDDHDYYVHADELRPVTWLDDETLLFTVLPQGAPKEYLVAWDVETGTLSRIACWPLGYAASFATDLLGP